MPNVLQVSRKVDYALRAMLHLSSRPDNAPISFKEVARLEDVPKDFLAKILRALVAEGLVNSTRGPRGGFSLARESSTISFLDVIEAIEGPVQLNLCLGSDTSCSRSPSCVMRDVWQLGQEKMLEVFRSTTLAELARRADSAAPKDSSQAA